MLSGRFQQSEVAKTLLTVVAITILVAVYLFQRVNIVEFAGIQAHTVHPNIVFIINRTSRLLLNDAACLLIVLVFFPGRRYLKVAFWIFLVELLLLLPIYFWVKLSLEGDSEISSPLLSQIHRLIVNPMLMLLLIAGFFYQRYIHGKSR